MSISKSDFVGLVAAVASMTDEWKYHEDHCELCLAGKVCLEARKLCHVDALVDTRQAKAVVLAIATFLEEDPRLEAIGENYAAAARVLLEFRDNPALRVMHRRDVFRDANLRR